MLLGERTPYSLNWGVQPSHPKVAVLWPEGRIAKVDQKAEDFPVHRRQFFASHESLLPKVWQPTSVGSPAKGHTVSAGLGVPVRYTHLSKNIKDTVQCTADLKVGHVLVDLVYNSMQRRCQVPNVNLFSVADLCGQNFS